MENKWNPLFKDFSYAWLNKMDNNKKEIIEIFNDTYGKDNSKCGFKDGEYFSFMCGDVWNGKWNRVGGFLTTDLGSNMLTIFLIFIAHWYLSLLYKPFSYIDMPLIKCLQHQNSWKKNFFVVTLVSTGFF